MIPRYITNYKGVQLKCLPDIDNRTPAPFIVDGDSNPMDLKGVIKLDIGLGEYYYELNQSMRDSIKAIEGQPNKVTQRLKHGMIALDAITNCLLTGAIQKLPEETLKLIYDDCGLLDISFGEAAIYERDSYIVCVNLHGEIYYKDLNHFKSNLPIQDVPIYQRRLFDLHLDKPAFDMTNMHLLKIKLKKKLGPLTEVYATWTCENLFDLNSRYKTSQYITSQFLDTYARGGFKPIADYIYKRIQEDATFVPEEVASKKPIAKLDLKDITEAYPMVQRDKHLINLFGSIINSEHSNKAYTKSHLYSLINSQK